MPAKSIPGIGQKKVDIFFIFSASSSRPLICTPHTTLESQEHGAFSKLSLVPIRGLEKFHFLYGDTSERVILKYFTPILQKKSNLNFRIIFVPTKLFFCVLVTCLQYLVSLLYHLKLIKQVPRLFLADHNPNVIRTLPCYNCTQRKI